jgi:hypothetical protein
MTRLAPLPVQVAVAGRARQRPLTVLPRLLMAIPHLVVLEFLAIAAAVIGFIGWWGALFTGRLPEFAATYLTGYVRWTTRVTGYVMLLTDVYPPFSLDDEPGYPVRVGVAAPGRLNRAAVFFRLILVIPANLLAGLAELGGATIVAFAGWLATLVTGQLPTSLHMAYAAVLRFTARANCYQLLLTPAYPGGLFGDDPRAAAYGSPGYGTPDLRMLLTSGAKRLVVAFIVIGAVTCAACLAVIIGVGVASGSNALQAGYAYGKVDSAYGTLTGNLNTWETTIRDCGTNFACVTAADARAATYFSAFANTLQGTSMPAAADASAGRLGSDATAAARDFTELSQTTSVSQYQATFGSTGLQQVLDNFDRDYSALNTELEKYS